MTLVELMIVAAIVVIFSASAITVFIQLIQTSDAVDAKIEAVKNCRFLLDRLSEDLSQAIVSGSIDQAELFNGTHSALSFGDLRDNDQDGTVDEESPDGQDNDGDWALAEDDHDLDLTIAGIPRVTLTERGLGEPDLGDGHVDEDVVFNQDEISFWIPGDSSQNILRQFVTYRIELFEGEENVAVRRVQTLHVDGSPVTEDVGPLAFEVVSLNFLYWDHTASPPAWVETWESGTRPLTSPLAPVTVYAEVTTYADTPRLALPPSRGLATVRVQTMANLENVLLSPLYPRGEDRDEGQPILSRHAESPTPAQVATASPAPVSRPEGPHALTLPDGGIPQATR